ncbi:MAG: hypothetical protein WCI77_10095 [Candidatus Omnitrophota bacterium]
MKKFFVFFLLVCIPLCVYGERLNIIYTGNTHASLYPCGHCPSSVGGGIARRASVIKAAREKLVNVLVVDSGNFTAGGTLDDASLSPELDQKRSIFFYQAMQQIGYDMVALGEEEYNFGIDFLKKAINEYALTCVSANITLDKIAPYRIKDFSGFKIAVIGLTPSSIYKTKGVAVQEYALSLAATLKQIVAKVDFIVLLSPLGDQENYRLAEMFKEIPLIISSGNTLGSSTQEKVGNTIILRPSFKAKEVRIAEIEIKDKKISDIIVKSESLGFGVKDDAEVAKRIPACFSDADCLKKEGFIARCQNPGALNALCVYDVPTKFEATVITDIKCAFASTTLSEKLLKSAFMGLSFRSVDYRTAEAQKIIKKYEIKTLPAILLPLGIKKEKNFSIVSNFLQEEQGEFISTKDLSGLFLLLDRKEIPRRIDFFLNPYEPSAEQFLKELLDFTSEKKVTLVIHLIIPPEKFSGYPEEELKTALALKQLYPDKFVSYILSRLKNIKNSSSIQTIDELGLDYKKIKNILASEKIEQLRKENNLLIEAVGINDGNVILINNNRVFKVFQLKKEDLAKFFEGSK